MYAKDYADGGKSRPSKSQQQGTAFNNSYILSQFQTNRCPIVDAKDKIRDG